MRTGDPKLARKPFPPVPPNARPPPPLAGRFKRTNRLGVQARPCSGDRLKQRAANGLSPLVSNDGKGRTARLRPNRYCPHLPQTPLRRAPTATRQGHKLQASLRMMCGPDHPARRKGVRVRLRYGAGRGKVAPLHANRRPTVFPGGRFFPAMATGRKRAPQTPGSTNIVPRGLRSAPLPAESLRPRYSSLSSRTRRPL